MADLKALNGFAEKLRSEDSDWVVDVVEALCEVTILVEAKNILAVCEHLKEKQDFDMLADLCGGDRGPEEDPRFEVNYHLFSTTHYHRLRLKVVLTEDAPNVPTVVGLWKTANWHERETYDLLGIIFDDQ